MLFLNIKTMPYKTTLFILGIVLLGNIENSQAQFFKKLKDKISKTVTETVDKVASKKNNPQKPNSQKGNKETHQNKTNNNNPTKQQTQEIDYADIFIYKSPSENFKDLHLQKYKDLPRFGACNFYMKNKTSPILTANLGKKRNMFTAGYTGFRKLALLNIFKEYASFLDKESLTPKIESTDYTEQEIKSYNIQRLIKELAHNVSADEIKRAYFCKDPNQKGCARNLNKWGGYNADDFSENEKYIDFVKKYFTELLQWSTQFFKDGMQTVYLANQIKFDNNGYDFDNNGYWIPIPIRNTFFPSNYTSTEETYFYTFMPKTTYGNDLLNKVNQVKYGNGEVLLSISPEKAEALVNKKLSNLYMVSKVKIVFKKIDISSPTYHTAQYTYHFESPILELFEDAALTQKVGEISLENLTYKADKL
jgi:hypothetical protein